MNFPFNTFEALAWSNVNKFWSLVYGSIKPNYQKLREEFGAASILC